ncbi:unnamed protein product [Lactuca saligna]|uniref:UBA domain-containing protein n=1 Tax=Lactuca saligna TaxID=75948 RepID=A0AA35Z476_LACSI|nr:unnamed protein product [Lactuca saligna]
MAPLLHRKDVEKPKADQGCIRSSNLEGTIQHLLDMGGGNWDRDTVVRALRVAFNNPEKVVKYLYCNSRQLPEFHHCQVCRLPSPRQLQLFLQVDQIQTLWISSLRDFLTWAQMLLLVLLATWIFYITVHSFKHFKPWCRLIPKSCRKVLIQNNFKIIIQLSWDVGFNDDWNIGMLEEFKAKDSEAKRHDEGF